MDGKVELSHDKGESHRIRSWLRLRDGLLGQLVRELSLLSSEARRKVLQQCFSQAQRVTLEQWMLRHRRVVSPQKTAAPRRKKRCQKFKVHRSLRSSIPGSKIKGVISATAQRAFYAVACLGMLRFTSRKTRDLWTAVGYREDLTRLVHRVESWRTGSLEERLLCAVTEALPSMRALDLHLEVRFRLQRWVAQPLSTPSFVATNQASLRRGLHAWRRLYTAREALRAAERAGPPSLREERSWMVLRNTFLDVESEAGLCRELREKRLAEMERSRAGHRQKLLERWNRQQMAHEDHLGKAARNRERAFFLRGARLLSKLDRAEEGLCKAKAALKSYEGLSGANKKPESKRRRFVTPVTVAPGDRKSVV